MQTLANRTVNAKTVLGLAGFLLILLLAYTWAQPFRDIYGLEARNALMGREMLEGGLSLIPTAMGHPYPDYPPLYFWLETLFSMFQGHVSALTASLPSALSAVALVALTFLLGRRLGKATGWLSALILASMPSFWLAAGRASIDMLLALNVTAALCFLIFRDQRESGQGGGWLAASAFFMVLAYLTKGPIGIVLPGVAWGGYLLWERRWKALFGFSLFVALVGIVCLGMEWATVYRTGGSRLVEEVIHMQVTGRLGKKSNHLFFYYGLCLLEMGGLWWILIAAAALRPKQGTRSADPGPPSIREWVRGHAPIRQAGAWVIGILAVFTLASTKKARYILPLYPAVAVLLGSWIVRLQEGRRLPASPRWVKSLLVVTAGLVLLSALFCLFFSQWVFVPHWALLLWMAAAAAGGWGISKRLTSRWQPVGAVLLLLFTGLLGVNLLVTPAVSRRASGRAFVQAAEARVDPRLPVVLYGIGRDGDGVKYALHSSRRPSSLRFVSKADALATMTPPFLFVMETRGQGGLPAPLASRRCHLVAKGHLRSHHLVAYRVDRQGPPVDAQKKETR